MELLAGTVTCRVPRAVELVPLGDVLSDRRGGYIDLTAGAVWPAELVEDGEVEGPEPFKESDPGLWLDVTGEGNRDAYVDVFDFTAQVNDSCARTTWRPPLEGRVAFHRFQAALDRHETYGVRWRVFCTELRSGRARAWLADRGYGAIP